MKIGNVEVTAATNNRASRLSLLLWGMSGVGKTTFACTLPGRKLIINLDPDGPVSVSHRGDVDIVDLSSLSTDDVLAKLKTANNPLNLDGVLREGTYQSVILDSATSLSQRALEDAVRQGLGASKKASFTPSMEAPGLAAYGGRNAILLTCIKGLLRVTGRYNVHVCIISHEDEPKTNEQGEILYITMMLGGKLVQSTSLHLSEVWWMQDDKAGGHRVAIRPCRQRKPMKTRMFDASSEPEFPLDYDPFRWQDISQNPLALWWSLWEKGDGSKLHLPGLRGKVISKAQSRA